MSTNALSHRERVKLALLHRETDRIPIAMVCSGINAPAYRNLQAYLYQQRHTSVEAYLKPLIDIKSLAPRYMGPRLCEGEDIWGVIRKPVSYGDGSYDEIAYYPLREMASIDQLRGYRWPSTAWYDYGTIPEQIARLNAEEDYCLMFTGGNIFECAWYMRGFQQAFMDMVIAPDLFDYIMEQVTTFFLEHIRKVLEVANGKIDLVFTADDIGGQRGLLMSLDMWQEHLKPYHVRQNALIHSLGARVIYHTDGSVMPAIPGLLDMGIDILQALQFDAQGMDPAAIKSQYGERLGFEGGISVQKTLPFGTPEQVRQEVLERIRVLGEGGGYILGPAHAIQAGTPPENIVALFDTAAGASLGKSL
jgi:uroporphyrinogen decarboxylase